MKQEYEKKENKERKNNSPLITICSCLALFFSLTLSILWCINVGGFEVVSLDSFVSVIVALLAVAVTFVIGWQIYNTIELKNKIEELEQLRVLSDKLKTELDQLDHHTRHLIGLTWGDKMYEKKKYLSAFRYYVISLYHTLSTPDPMNIGKISKLIKLCGEKMTLDDKIPQDKYNEIIKTDELIRQLPNYSLIDNWYNEAYELFDNKTKP